MQVTGLRGRYFLTIMAVLVIVASASILLHSVFLKQERLELIDQQVRETASALVDSDLGGLKQVNFDQADEIISEELGETRIGKFFIIRNQSGDVIFETLSAKLLPIAEVPRSPQWVQINVKGKFIRILNLQLPRFPDRTLQVGLVLDESIVNPDYISKSTIIFILTIIFIGLTVSWVSTTFLLRPIAELEKFLSSVSEKSKYQTKLPSIPENLKAANSKFSNDEFERMVAVLDNLIGRVNKNYELSRLWAYQMAHELKTPLSILKLQVENIAKKQNLTIDEIEPITVEEKKISDTINSFLAWAELENSTKQQHLFINKVSESIESVCIRLFRDSKRPIHKGTQSNFSIVANPQHLEQLISNILSNAHNYTEVDKPIYIETFDRALVIRDSGSGISQDVISRLGEPFNRGEYKIHRSEGHGLGLAWVKSICKIYDWEVLIKSDSHGTEVKIDFKQEGFSVES